MHDAAGSAAGVPFSASTADCPQCGYARRGLADDALCPECGAPPAVPIVPVFSMPGAARDRAEQAWLACVAVGLALLVVSSFYALHVALATPLGGLVLTTMNAPGPKVWAASLLMRQIGHPGEWGVTGTVAVLGNLLAVWLVTEPRAAQPGADATRGDAVRRLARWTAVIGTGAFVGFLWGEGSISLYWSWDGLLELALAVGLIELPVNALLYWHLANVATRFDGGDDDGGGRIVPLLRRAAVLLPITCAVGVAASLVRGYMQDRPVVPWRFAQVAYGALVLTTGMLMCAGVLRLLASAALAATDKSVASLAGKLARLRGTLGRFAAGVRADPTRWAAVLGLAVWLWNTWPMIATNALIDHRRGLGGDWPTFNFVGPKVWAVAFFHGDYRYYAGDPNRAAVITTVLAVWLITSFRPAGAPRWLATAARWAPTVLVGMGLALAMTISQATPEVRASHWAAAMIACVEAPSTLLVYAYLAALAGAAAAAGGAARTLARHVRRVAVAATVLILTPLAFFILSAPLRPYQDHPLAVFATAAYGAAAIGAGVAACAVVFRLAWTLATWRRPVDVEADAYNRDL